ALIQEVSEGVKEAKSIKVTIKTSGDAQFIEGILNEGVTDDNDKVDISKALEREITFDLTKEQINNGEMLKALAMLQLGIDKGNIVANGDEVYATIDVATVMDGLSGILMQNADYFKGVALDGIFSEQNIANLSFVAIRTLFDYDTLNDAQVDALSKKVSAVVVDLYKGNEVEANFKALVKEIFVLNGADADAISNAIDYVMKDTNYFSNLVDLFNTAGWFEVESYNAESGLLEANEELSVKFYNACNNIAEQMDNLFNDRDETLATVVMAELPNLKEVIENQISISTEEDDALVDAYDYFLMYVEPVLTEDAINDMIANYKALKAMNFDEIKAGLIETISHMFSVEGFEEFKQAMNEFVTSETCVVAISNNVANYIEAMLGLDAGSTAINEKFADVMRDVYAGEDYKQSVKALLVEIAPYIGLDANNVADAVDNIIDTNNYFESIVDLMKNEGAFDEEIWTYDEANDTYDYVREFTEDSEKIYNAVKGLAIQYDNKLNGREVNLLSAYADILLLQLNMEIDSQLTMLEAYLEDMAEHKTELEAYIANLTQACEDAETAYNEAGDEEKEQKLAELQELQDQLMLAQDRLDDLTNRYDSLLASKESILSMKDLNDPFKNLAIQLDNLFNGKDETVASEIITLMNTVDKILTSNFEGLAESFAAVYGMFKAYFMPQITEEGLNAIIANLKAFNTMTSSEIFAQLASDFEYFAHHNSTVQFVNDAVLTMLQTYFLQNADGHMEYVFDNEYQLQQYIVDIKDAIVQFIYAQDKDVATLVADIKVIMDENDFANKFENADIMMNFVSATVNCLTQETVTETDKQLFAMVLAQVYGIDFINGPDDSQDVLMEYVDNVRSVLLNADMGEQEKLFAILNYTDELFQYVKVDIALTNVVAFVNGMATSYQTNENHNIEFYTNYYKVMLKNMEDAEVKAVAIKLANIIDNLPYYTDSSEFTADIVELISLPRFTEVISNGDEGKAMYAQMARIFLYVALEVPDVDYNELMQDFADFIPASLGTIDFNDFVQYLRDINCDNMFTINDVKVTLVEDQQGNVIGQKAVFYASFNFDAYFGDVDADFTFELDMAY
ncbi:MAG: hypothetical protein ACI4TX_02910, partial [Christensenellales bacterium]